MVWSQKKERRHFGLPRCEDSGCQLGSLEGAVARVMMDLRTSPTLEVGLLSLCLLGVQCFQSRSTVSRNKRFKEHAEEEWEALGIAQEGEALVVIPRPGRVKEAETQGVPRLLAREMVIMEADTQPDPVPSALHVSRKYREFPHIYPTPYDITQSPKLTLGFPPVLDSLWV